MSQAIPAAHCPDCGAPVKAGDKQCWMCLRMLEWEGAAVRTRGGNQFADAPASAHGYRYLTNVWAILGIVFAALAMVPAALIACVVTCAVAWDTSRGANEGMPFIVGLVSGVVVLVGFCVLIGALSTRVTRKVVW